MQKRGKAPEKKGGRGEKRKNKEKRGGEWQKQGVFFLIHTISNIYSLKKYFN